MSIKGIDKELFIGKTEVNIFDSKRKRYTIKYENLDKIEYRLADQENGKLYFLTKKKKISFAFKKSENDSILRAINYIQDKSSETSIELLSEGNRSNAPKSNLVKIRHQKCKSCGKNYDSETDICPYCNYSNTDTHFKWLFVGFITMVCMSVIVIFVSHFTFSKTISDAKDETFIPQSTADTTISEEIITEAFTTTLTAGHYVVGIDIPVGTYSFFSKKGMGNLVASDGSINAIFDYENQAGNNIGISGLGTEELKNIYLNNGVIITVTATQEISAGCGDGEVSNMQSRNQDTLEAVELGYGLYSAGDDFLPGTYNIQWLEGFGNIQTDPYEIDYGINEIMGELSIDNTIDELSDKISIKQYNNLILKEGDILKINDIKVKLIPSE